MPYRVRKAPKKSEYLIQVKRPSGWVTVGRSKTKTKAEASVRARKGHER